ncbi:pleckstrin homology domain-containing family A member 4 isoform X1 [Pogona vitticeps]
MSEGNRPKSGLSQASSTATISSVSMGTKRHSARSVQKVHTFGKRANSIKRDPNSPVIMRGWLYKQDSSGLKLWKRRWFVLSNYCLFYYRDSREEMVLGSIPLPSYEIRTAFSKEKKNRRFVFKAEHPGMRTYYFSAETQLDMNSWIRAMKQSAAAECNFGTYNRGLHSQSVSTHTSFEDVTLVPEECAKSSESLEITHLSEKREDEVSSSESLHAQDSQTGSPSPRRISLSSSFNGGYLQEMKDQPDLSSLSSQTHGCPSPVSCTKFITRPPSPPPPHPSESPSPSSLSRTPQPSPLLSIRSSRSYSLPLTPADSPRVPEASPSQPVHVRRKPPRMTTAQAASCEDISAGTSPRTLVVRPNTPMGRVDIAPSEGPPNNPYGVLSPTTRGRSLTPADRYDVHPSTEDPYGRRYARSPHPLRARPAGEDGLTPSLGRPQPNRFIDRGYVSPSSGPSRALVMSRLHGRLITPHSASSSYLHLPPLPPMPNRPTPGKRTSLGTMSRNPARERNIHSGSGRFESDTDALLTKLCGQDKLLCGLEEEMVQLRAEKERLEKALEVTRQRLEDFKGQDATMEKISYQQRQLQDELVQIRARLCDLALDCERAWEDYAALENELQMLKGSLEHIRRVGHPQDQTAAQQDLWRIHDILAGLRSSPANCHTLESRRSGVSPASIPVLDSHLGVNHSPSLPGARMEESEVALPPKSSISFHESTLSHTLALGEPSKTMSQLESRQQDGIGARGQPPSPPTSNRGQQGAPSHHSNGIMGSPTHCSSQPSELEKGNPARGIHPVGLDHGNHTSVLNKDAEHSVAKVASSETTVSRSGRMSAQEQLIRMQRNQEARRKSEAAQASTQGSWRDSLKRGSGRVGVKPCTEEDSRHGRVPLPNNSPESSPKEGVQSGGLKPPRCPPTPEWERQRVIQLSYALAAEASQQRGKRLAGRSSSHSSLDDNSATQESQNHHHLPNDSIYKNPESNSRTSEHDHKATLNLSCSSNSGTTNKASSSSYPTNQKPCALKASDCSLPHTDEDGQLSSKPKSQQLTSNLKESTNKESALLDSPPRVATVHQSANQNLCFSGVADWPPTVLWDSEVWASEHNLGGNQGIPANGRCPKWRGENASRQVVSYFGDSMRPVKVTLVKTSF